MADRRSRAAHRAPGTGRRALFVIGRRALFVIGRRALFVIGRRAPGTGRRALLVTVVRAFWTDAFASLTARPLRTAAMMAGIVLGVASTTAAVLIADTQQVQIDKRFDAQRSRFVVLQANGDASAGFAPDQVAAVTALEPVSAAGELSIWRESAPVGVNPFVVPLSVPLVGATSAGLQAAEVTAVAGVPASGVDALADRSVVWLGADLAARLGVDLFRPETVSIAGLTLTVAGVLRGGSAFGYLNASAILPRALAQRSYGRGTTLRFLARVRPGAAAAVGRYARAVLDPEQRMSLADVTQPDGRILLGSVAADLRRIGLSLGAFVGFVGMVAVANTLSMSVSQRSRELGLRAAMGWNRRRIGVLVLVESGIAGLVAAVIGCGFGLAAAVAWCVVQGWELIVSPWLGPLVILAGTASSLVGGLLPAHRAASVSPLVAMRS
jgi:putative ABC transport system permease protein